MSNIKITSYATGTNNISTLAEPEKIRIASTVEKPRSFDVEENESSTSTEVSAPQTDAERRAARREEYREAAAIRQRALQMQKQAEQRIKETESFASLMQQAKEDPTVLAKALGMDLTEFQRKLFNKAYQIEEEQVPAKEESFEEKTNRRLMEYEKELESDRVRRQEEMRRQQELESERIKHTFISNQILPHITENHEFILRNDKHSCAALVYDMMNQAFMEHCSQGGTEADFPLKAEDVINEMEEELERRSVEQLTQAKSINKLKKFFSEEDRPSRQDVSQEDWFPKKNFSKHSSPTLSRSMGTVGAPPVLGQKESDNSSPSFSDKRGRLSRLKKVLGQ